jgi:hypothetical protein
MYDVEENHQMYILESLWKNKEPSQLWETLPQEIILYIFQQTCPGFRPFSETNLRYVPPDEVTMTATKTPESEKVIKDIVTNEVFDEYCQSRESLILDVVTETMLYPLSTKVLRKPPAVVIDKMLEDFEQGRIRPITPKYEEYPLFDAAVYYMQNLKPELSITWIAV